MGKSGAVSCGVTAPFSGVLMCTRFCLCPPRVCVSSGGSIVGVNGDPQEGLCHTQVCCTRSPCPCSRPLLTRTSTGDTQTPKGRSGSVSVGSPGMHKVLFEPSAHLWWSWGLILNAISALLPSCWGFSFALGRRVSFLVGSNVLLLMAAQQWIVILEFSQEKMSTRPSTPPSWIVMGKYLVSTYVPGTMPSIGSLSLGLMFFFVK